MLRKLMSNEILRIRESNSTLLNTPFCNFVTDTKARGNLHRDKVWHCLYLRCWLHAPLQLTIIFLTRLLPVVRLMFLQSSLYEMKFNSETIAYY